MLPTQRTLNQEKQRNVRSTRRDEDSKRKNGLKGAKFDANLPEDRFMVYLSTTHILLPKHDDNVFQTKPLQFRIAWLCF